MGRHGAWGKAIDRAAQDCTGAGRPVYSLTPPATGLPMTPPRRTLQELSDAELDAYILTRLALAGVDLAVLPEDDSESPADQRRILAGARRFLRSTPGAIAGFAMDPQEVAPALYPAAWGPALAAPGGEGGA